MKLISNVFVFIKFLSRFSELIITIEIRKYLKCYTETFRSREKKKKKYSKKTSMYKYHSDDCTRRAHRSKNRCDRILMIDSFLAIEIQLSQWHEHISPNDNDSFILLIFMETEADTAKLFVVRLASAFVRYFRNIFYGFSTVYYILQQSKPSHIQGKANYYFAFSQ